MPAKALLLLVEQSNQSRREFSALRYHMGIPGENVAKKAPQRTTVLLPGKKCRSQLIELHCIFCVDLVLAFRKNMKR